MSHAHYLPLSTFKFSSTFTRDATCQIPHFEFVQLQILVIYLFIIYSIYYFKLFSIFFLRRVDRSLLFPPYFKNAVSKQVPNAIARAHAK